MGPSIWTQAKAPSQILIIGCGNLFSTRLLVKPDFSKHYKMGLDATRFSVHVGGGQVGQATLKATATDSQGKPLKRLWVRFQAHHEEDDKPAGTSGGSGTNHDRALTRNAGVASIPLFSDERESQSQHEWSWTACRRKTSPKPQRRPCASLMNSPNLPRTTTSNLRSVSLGGRAFQPA